MLKPAIAMGAFLLLLTGTARNIYSFDKEFFENIEQPIEFSHKTHAEINKISCEYCHTEARRSRSSGIPPVRTCVGCHIVIKGETEEKQQKIEKLMTFWENKEQIPWKKIHDLPDFVYFSHKRHLSAGFDCTSCHGDISALDRAPVPVPARSNDPLTMGWCVTCHIEPHPVGKDMKIALPQRRSRGGEVLGEAPEGVSEIKGNMDCLVCHQ